MENSMKFNKEKSQIIFHTKIARYQNFKEWKGLKVVTNCKCLGYMLDQNTNNLEQVNYLQKKINKTQKMLLITSKSKISKWRNLYIFSTYQIPILSYAAAQLLITRKSLNSMFISQAFKKFKALYYTNIKIAL